MLESLHAWRERRQAMRELRRMRRDQDELDVWTFKGRLEEAQSAFVRGDRKMLREIWADILARYRKHIAPSREALDLQLDMEWFDQADELLLEAQARRPRDPLYAIGLARVAQRRGDLEGAIKRWAEVRKRFPQMPDGYAQGAASLAKAGRFDEAEAVLANAFRKMPRDFHTRLEYARLAETQRDWETALTRWGLLREIFPQPEALAYQMGTIGIAMCLRRLRRFDESEAALLALRMSMPLNPLPAVEYAGVAEDKGDLPEAVHRWQQVKSRFPMWQHGYANLVRVLRETGQADEIEALLAEAADRFPEDAVWFIDYAACAEARGDFAAAAARWDKMRKLFPQREEAYRRGADALAAVGQGDAAAALRAEHARRFTT